MRNPDPPAPQPPGGFVAERSFLFPVRIYYEDTDFSGVVYHANYLKFMERGRSEFLRAAGVRQRALRAGEEPLVWVVRRMEIDFLRPARVDEALLVRTRVLGLGGARITLGQAVERAAEVLVKARVEVCVVTLPGRPRRVPDAVRESLGAYL
jgi:acyl-CoA thioester hydrolase